jgi:hypothetical protein
MQTRAWRNGRRARLRIWFRKDWRFKSSRAHHFFGPKFEALLTSDNQIIGWRYMDYSRNSPLSSQVFLQEEVPRVITPKLSSSDLQFLANRKFSCTEICSAFGVPEEIITTTNAAKYDVMAGARLNFIENRVLPLCRRLEAEDDVTVKSIDPTADGWFDVEDHPVVAAARRERLAAARTGFDMGVPFNELNRVFDLGFKPLPWGDQGHIPSTMRPADGGGLSPKGG